MVLMGKAFKFGNDINTDYIIPAKYKAMTEDIEEMSQYLMKEIAPDLVERIKPGDFLVAGYNFGCGSSREAAPLVIKGNGISAVLAHSFGRIFFRNAINIGLPVVECDTDIIAEGDVLNLDLERDRLVNSTTGQNIAMKPMPKFIKRIINEGGILNFLKAYKLENIIEIF
jgi:3-isopropylmalate/(R)-2-methylmalate dehydratase small subunit